MLNALYAYKAASRARGCWAEKACEIEIDILKKPIGRQDHTPRPMAE